MEQTDSTILTRPFPPQAVKQRKIGGGMMASYVDGTTVIRRLNEATGNNWSFTVDRHWLEGQLSYALVTLTLPGCGSRQHIGVQSTDSRSGEDAVAKGAITDALKKAATLFGVGLELYGPDYEDDEAPQPRQNAPQPQGQAHQPQRVAEHIDRETGEITRPSGPTASEKQINYILALGKQRGFVAIGDDGLEHANEAQIIGAVNRDIRTSYNSVQGISRDDAKRVLDLWAPSRDGQQQQQRPAPTPIRQDVAPVAAVGDDTAWTTLWKELREAGVPSGNIPAATDLIGTWNSNDPVALLATLRMKVASMPRQQGSAGLDRHTS